ncbi:NAD(P)/FAD-dependent oxidoreductase [bacterium]|jgi:NADH:ubiquinone reductase (H+-translocating)|nr:NAD(P)/FAD-dependent oxidoreductase [bacterium]
MSPKKVIIIGGGFGGLNAAKGLARANHEVVLIDKTNHHLFQPLLYQVASAVLSPSDIAAPIREVLSHQKNTTVFMGNVVKIDKKARKVHLQNGDVMDYDYLIVGVGARHSYFGRKEWEKHAPGIKTIPDALQIRETILTSFEKAERCDSISQAQKFLNFVIIGGGPTGVEVAGAIAEIAHKTMLQNFRRIDTTKTKVYLVEGSPSILPVYPQKLSNKAQQYLEGLGVQVLTGKMVSDITEEGVGIGDRFIESENVIWAAGNQASPLLKTLKVELDRQGRCKVEADLSVPGYPEVFVIGDASHCKGKTDQPVPSLAPAAVQMGRYVARIIKKETPLEKRRPFYYVDKGTMATIGKAKAIGMFGHIRFSGYPAWLAWCFVHIMYLIGFRNRFLVVLEWTFSYMSNHRGSRLIHSSIEKLLSKSNQEKPPK